MGNAEDWQRLVEQLDSWTAASEAGPGRIRVSVPQATGIRQAVVVMTPDEWGDMTGVMWGSFDDAVEDVKRSLLDLEPHHDFAVYEDYRLWPSAEAALVEALDPPPEPGGDWQTTDRDGRVTSRFADWSGPDGP